MIFRVTVKRVVSADVTTEQSLVFCKDVEVATPDELDASALIEDALGENSRYFGRIGWWEVPVVLYPMWTPFDLQSDFTSLLSQVRRSLSAHGMVDVEDFTARLDAVLWAGAAWRDYCMEMRARARREAAGA